MSFRSLLIILLLGLLPPDGAEDGRTGNRHFEAGRYDEAARAYTRGLEAAPAEARGLRTRLYQNLGSARYRLQQFEDAQTAFDRGLQLAESADARATLAYNAGNAAFQREELEAAADYYRQALLADPSRRDAKYNYELVQRRLQERRSQRSSSNSNRKSSSDSSSDSSSQSSSGSQNEQQRQSDRQQNGGQAGSQNEQRSSSDSNRSQEGQQSGQKERSPQAGNSENQEQQAPNRDSGQGENESQTDRSSGDSDDSGENGENSARAAGRAGDERQQLTREDAQRILRALEGSEKELLRELRRPPSESASPPSDKDW